VLHRLAAEEARDVLGKLLASHPHLVSEAEDHARTRLGALGFPSIAVEVERAVRALDIDELGRRSGRHAGGYVGPPEAAWEILEEVTAPFLEDVVRKVDLGLEDAALAACQGVVLGLYRVDHGKAPELLGWASDFAAEAAGDLVESWAHRGQGGKKRKTPARVLPKAFVERHVPAWSGMIGRCQGGGRSR